MSEDVSAGRLVLEVVGDTSGLRADLKAKVDAISAQIRAEIKADLKLDAAQAQAEIQKAARDRVVTLLAKADTTTADADLDKTAADRTAKITAKADTTTARTDLDTAAKDRTTTIKAKTDKASLDTVASDIGEKLTSVSIPVFIGSGLITAVGAAGNLAGALVAVAAAASQAVGVIGAIPGLLLAAAQAGGAAELGFHGIAAAVSASEAAQNSAKTSATQYAQAQQSAADAVRTSLQALTNAQITGPQQAAAAQHALQQAITAVADAQYNAAQSIATSSHAQQQAVIALSDARYNASQSVTTSEHTLTDALYSEQQAQLAVTQARQAAVQNLIQTSFDLRGAVIGEAQAALNLQEARTKLTETDQSAASTAQQKQQAQLDLQQAKLAYAESVNTTSQAAKAKKTADQQGVSGSQTVIQAQHAQQDAAFSLQQAEQAVARARVEATRSIQEAQYELTQSVQAAARAQVTASESVKDAEYSEAQAAQSLANTRRTDAQQLENAQIAYREAVKAAAQPTLGLSSQTTALQQAMASLTPAGRKFVDFITSTLLPAYKKAQQATQTALLPGVQQGLQSALPLLGTLRGGLTGTASVLGAVARKTGQWLGSAGVNADLSGILKTNEGVIRNFGDAALHVADAIRNVVVAAEPLVVKISEFADKLAKGADSLSKTGRSSGDLAGFFDRAWKSASQLARIVGNLVGFIGHLFGAAAPAGSSLLGSLVDATGKLDKWAGSGGGQAKMQAFFQNTIPVARQFGDLLVHAASVIGKLVGGFGGGELNGLFSVLNLALSILSTLTKLPGFGQVVQWVLVLSGVGAGLGMVAGKIGAIGKGLSALTKISGLDALAKKLGLGDSVGGALGGGLKKLGGKILGKPGGIPDELTPAAGAERVFAVSGAGEAEEFTAAGATGLYAVPQKLKGLWTAAGSAASGFASNLQTWLSSAGQAAAGFASSVGSALSKAGGYLADAARGAGTWAAGVGSSIGQAAASFGAFVAGLARQAAEAAVTLATWVAEHTVAAATYIAENVAMAASATAAFIAENAATLGIIAAVIGIVAAIVYVATHWSQVWGDIKKWASDAWNFIYNGIGKYLLVLLGPAGLIILGIIEVSQHWQTIWGDIKKWAKDAWDFIYNGIGQYLLPLLGTTGLIIAGITAVSKSWSTIWGAITSVVASAYTAIKKGTTDAVGGLKTAWAKIRAAFEDPVKFVVNTVYDDGIAKLWNWVADKLDFPKLKILHLAQGGRVPGTGTGDHVPALLEPRERVLSREQVSKFGGGSLDAGHDALDRLVGRGGGQWPAYQDGGILPWLKGLPGDVSHAVLAGTDSLLDGAKFLASALSNPVGTVEKLLAGPLAEVSKINSTPVGKMIGAIPKYIVSQAGKAVEQFLGIGGGGGVGNVHMTPPTVTGTVQQWFAKAMQLTGSPASWLAPLETIGYHESTDNPYAINNSDSNAAAGDPARGIMQEIMTTFLAWHLPGTSTNIYDPVANIASAIRYIASRYGTPFNTPGIRALSEGRSYVGYDAGGPLKPGATTVLNGTGENEWVLTPGAVDLLGGAPAIARMNMAGNLYRSTGSAGAASAVSEARPAAGTATVNVYPQPGMSEQTIGDAAARKLGFLLN
ncbi:MAG TPA: hypothetical protein VGG54_22685 [Trebonia sp.]